MTDLLELAARCEAAMGPSHHLDVQIFILLDPDAQHIVGNKPGRFPQEAIYGPRSSFWEWAIDETKEPPVFAIVPEFTASLDAAMTLVPEGLRVTHSGEGRFLERGRFVATIEQWASEKDEEGQEIFTTPLRRHGVAQTFPLALCAAALKARAANA